MKLNFFSLLILVLLVVAVVLGWTYYHLFENTNSTNEYSKYDYSAFSNSSKDYNLSDLENTKDINESLSSSLTNNIKETIVENKDFSSDKEKSLKENKIQTQEPALKQETLEESNIKAHLQENEENFKTMQEEKDLNKTQIPLDKNISTQETKPLNLASKSQKNQAKKSPKKTSLQKNTEQLSTIKEYQQRGKYSRLEPKLSTEYVKVYVVNGKMLSNYRINLLKDILEPIYNRSSGYSLSIFIEMLPKSEMSISIYNKDIIFSSNRKNYKYITMNQLNPYLADLENIGDKIKREEVIQRTDFDVETDLKGSQFAKHLRRLKVGVNVAQHFFPFCEAIYVGRKK